MIRTRGVFAGSMVLAMALLVGCAKQGTIVGAAYDAYYGVSLQGAAVTLYKGSTAVDSTTTDSGGTYYFADVEEGSYAITIAYPGSAPASYVEQFSLDGGSTWEDDANQGDDLISASVVAVSSPVTVVHFRFEYLAAF